MTYTEELDYEDICRIRYHKAREYATEKHEGQKRVGGEDYISHPLGLCVILYVTNNLTLPNIIVALLHDVLEDTDSTEAEMKSMVDITDEEMYAVKLLTKGKGYNMEDYMSKIAQNEIAKIVKIADRIHNLQSSIIEEVTDSFRNRYLVETKQYFIDMAKGTGMEDMLYKSIELVESKLKESGYAIG